jgi:hypothetical protein
MGMRGKPKPGFPLISSEVQFKSCPSDFRRDVISRMLPWLRQCSARALSPSLGLVSCIGLLPR